MHFPSKNRWPAGDPLVLSTRNPIDGRTHRSPRREAEVRGARRCQRTRSTRSSPKTCTSSDPFSGSPVTCPDHPTLIPPNHHTVGKSLAVRSGMELGGLVPSSGRGCDRDTPMAPSVRSARRHVTTCRGWRLLLGCVMLFDEFSWWKMTWVSKRGWGSTQRFDLAILTEWI